METVKIKAEQIKKGDWLWCSSVVTGKRKTNQYVFIEYLGRFDATNRTEKMEQRYKIGKIIEVKRA